MQNAGTRHRRTLLAVTIGLLAGIAIGKATAQAPVLDPPRVAPHIFEVLLDNRLVRVLKVTERNGETQPLHARAHRVVVHMSPCAWVVEEEDGETRMESFEFGDVYWRNAVTLGGHTSNVIEECRSVEIELKTASMN